MKKTTTAFLGVLFLSCLTAVAHATIYPPGPGGGCPADTLLISHIQSSLFGSPTGPCSPVLGDSVRGVKGIIIGVDPHATGFAIYFQEPAGGPWTGIDIFTGGNNVFAAQGLALGDEIAAYGSVNNFLGEDQIVADDGSFGSNLLIRKISSGNPLPPFKTLLTSEAHALAPAAMAEPWEGTLVRVEGPLRVVRNTGLGTRIFAAVSNTTCAQGAPGPCDSVHVDGQTLSNPRFDAPANGTLIQSVQGILNERTSGYRIQLRDGNDIVVATPPNLVDAYPLGPDSIRVLFDRNVTQASAENVSNYGLTSFGLVNSATLVEPNAVHLHISSAQGPGDNEGVTVNNIVSVASGLAMTVQQTANFFNDVLNVTNIQAPDPDSLTMSSAGCEDRSRFSGTGTFAGQRTSMRAVAVARFGSLYYLQDAVNPTLPRSGIAIFAPITVLTVGHKYLLAGAIQEFFSETEMVNNVYVRDEGAVGVMGPITKDLSVFRDNSCDATQSKDTADDYEGQLVRIVDVHILNDALPGQGFLVGENAPNFEGPFQVRDRSNSIQTFDATPGNGVEVTGLLGQFGGVYDIDPRDDTDIVDLGQVVNVPVPGAGQLRFAIHPNPAQQAKVSLGLPKADLVDLGVFDLLGRRLATLASGRLEAGDHSFIWGGNLSSGKRAQPGVYFYRLKIGKETRTLRSVLID